MRHWEEYDLLVGNPWLLWTPIVREAFLLTDESLRRYEDTCSQIEMVLSPRFRTSVIPALNPTDDLSLTSTAPLALHYMLWQREAGGGVEDWGELNAPACCLTERRSANPSTLSLVSARHCCSSCHCSLFAVTIFSSHMYAWRYSQLFWTPLHAYIKKGWKWGLPGWSMVGGCLQRDEIGWARRLFPYFLQGFDVYALCVYASVCEHTYTGILHLGHLELSPSVGKRHLESPEEIQTYCIDSIYIYRTVYKVHLYIYILDYR